LNTGKYSAGWSRLGYGDLSLGMWFSKFRRTDFRRRAFSATRLCDPQISQVFCEVFCLTWWQ